MELSLAQNGESCHLLGILIQLHLPETGGQVQGHENGGVGSAYFADAFGDLLHRVLVDMGFRVELPEVLHDSKSLALLLGNAENG